MKLPNDPLNIFNEWFTEVKTTSLIDPTAMALATASPTGIPSVRMVLMKNFDQTGLVFYTNYGSRKALEILANPLASACFHWDTLGKQIRISGRVESVTPLEADVYFASRDRESQIGAWASLQSQPMQARAEFEARFLEVDRRFEGQVVLRPPHWSGFRIVPHQIEFWKARPHRLHDRWVYTRAKSTELWQSQLLFP